MRTSTTSIHFSQELLEIFHPRKFLFHSSLYPIETPAQQNNIHSMINYFHANATITVPLFLICTIISSLGLNCIIKYCVIRASNSVVVESGVNPTTKLVNAGVEMKDLNAFPIVKYATEMKPPGLDISCVICLSEFDPGERLRISPNCNHGFHIRCIDTWLGSHSSCPTCRQYCMTESDQKTDNCSQTESLPVQETLNIEVN